MILKKAVFYHFFGENHCFDPFQPNEPPQVLNDKYVTAMQSPKNKNEKLNVDFEIIRNYKKCEITKTCELSLKKTFVSV